MSMQFLLCEAAAYFGIPVDELKRKPVERRAEMMAHMLLKDARDGYVEHLKAEQSKRQHRKESSYDPAASVRRQFGLVD